MKNIISFSRITGFFITIYLIFSLKSFYDIFFPKSCPESPKTNNCIYQINDWYKEFQFSVCLSSSRPRVISDCSSQYQIEENLDKPFDKEISLKLPKSTLKNGTLTAYFILNKNNDQTTKTIVIKEFRLSKYKLNITSSYLNLLEIKQSDNQAQSHNVYYTHLLKKIKVYTVKDQINFYRNEIPYELFYDLKLDDKGYYLPYLHIDKLFVKDDDYMVLNKSQTSLNLTLIYYPISIGQLHFQRQIENSFDSMKQLGFNDGQLDELISVFSEIDFKILLITLVVSVVHLFFEILSFKNDISFWRNRKTIVGLSVKTMFWRLLSQIIIFAYLLIEETSYLVLLPSGISVFIELWKLLKALKINIYFKSYFIPQFHVCFIFILFEIDFKIYSCFYKFTEMTASEKETNSYDSIAMKKLSYVLYPLCICGAIYSLIYNKHKNWLQWLINSLVNGVYAFGFLFMTPQLFLNYKMKSVAHLPWKAFMYKAFNTFIDDVFAFIIKMPTAHRLACLRDDVIFLIYLYQRWLYPIDKSRINEFGESFEESEKTKAE